MDAKGKSTNSLMRHIRKKHEIDIEGSRQKQELLNMGYYHGYKAYRFIDSKENIQPYEKFSEIKAVYDFDHELKALLYPTLMKIETSLKNRTIDLLVQNSYSDIEFIYNHYLNSYRDYYRNRDQRKYRQKKLEFKAKMTSTIVYNYKNSTVIQHFINKGKPIPLWAYFEVTTLGEYGQFIECLNKDVRVELLKRISFYHSGIDPEGKNLKTIIYLINDLRNAVMHNSVIYDCRFKKSKSNSSTNQQISRLTDINDIDFNNITDYIILLIILESKIYQASKTQLRQRKRKFIALKEKLHGEIPSNTYNSIFNTNNNNKLMKLKLYIDNI